MQSIDTVWKIAFSHDGRILGIMNRPAIASEVGFYMKYKEAFYVKEESCCSTLKISEEQATPNRSLGFVGVYLTSISA